MVTKLSRRSVLILLFLSSCGVGSKSLQGIQITIGTVSYGATSQSNQYDRFKEYLAQKLQALVQLEPAFNERKALERIRSQAWSIVFAPPGLAAIAMTQHQYTPLFPLTGVNNLRSVLVVQKNSSYSNLQSLAGKALAIGQPGSATGYYFPIFNLYGLTLKELLVSPTPKAVLEAVAQGKAEAGALSQEEFDRYRTEPGLAEFRILYSDPHRIPPGVLLIGPGIDRTLQESIREALRETPSAIAQEAGLLPTGSLPDYKYMISVVDRVRSIFPADRAEGIALLEQKPVRLFTEGNKTAPPVASPEPGSAVSAPGTSPSVNSSPGSP
ncbi:MAG: phosphonate ABC transporter substrate-binding protein [Leptolyngbya sp. ERB_1_1]